MTAYTKITMYGGNRLSIPVRVFAKLQHLMCGRITVVACRTTVMGKSQISVKVIQIMKKITK